MPFWRNLIGRNRIDAELDEELASAFEQLVAERIAGVLLAAMGFCGVTAYSVARRTREIGIRIAMGAERSTIAAMVLRQAMTVGVGATWLFTLLCARVSVRVQVWFVARNSKFGVSRTQNLEPSNWEPNLNTNREGRTEKRERCPIAIYLSAAHS
jgi:hypothetical protein